MKADWQKLKRIALDHPYFDIRGNVLSDAEAESIVQSMCLDAKAFIRNAYADMETDTDPLGIDSCIEQIIAQFKAEPRRERARNTPRSIRRWAIVAAIVLCLTVFFTLTKPGVALANTIYQAIVEIVDGVFRSKQQDSAVPAIDINTLPTSFNIIEEAENYLGVSIAHIEARELTLSSINVVNAEDVAIVIRSRYALGTTSILVEQTVGTQNALSGTATSVKDSELDEYVFSDSITWFVGEMNDGTIFARCFMADYEVFISEYGVPKEVFLTLLDSLSME